MTEKPTTSFPAHKALCKADGLHGTFLEVGSPFIQPLIDEFNQLRAMCDAYEQALIHIAHGNVSLPKAFAQSTLNLMKDSENADTN